MSTTERSIPQVAKWKIDSDEERRLAQLADRSEDAKKVYVEFYRKSDPVYFEKGLPMIHRVIDQFRPDADEKQREAYVIDMVYSLHRFGCMFDEYFQYNYPMLNTAGRESFVTDKGRWKYYERLNKGSYDLFTNKEATYELFGKYYHRELLFIRGEEDRETFRTFAEKHGRFFVKLHDGSGGRGARIVTVKNDADRVFDKLLGELGTFLCEELIRQSAAMAAIHSGSVNTLRLPMIRTKGGIKPFYPFFRVGVGNSVVDNAASGGIFALVDPETGILYTEGTNETGGRFLRHPDSGIPFPGFRLPDWEQALQLARELSEIRPMNRYVGWDLAHTDDGWIMVEANPCGQFVMQIFMATGITDELEKLIES